MAEPIPPQVSLRVFRESAGLTIDELATAIADQGVQVSRPHLNNIELGHKPPSEAVLLAYARALGIKRTHIRTGTEIVEWVDAVRADALAGAAA